MRRPALLLLVIVTSVAWSVRADEVTIDRPLAGEPWGKHVDVLEDARGTLTLADVQKRDDFRPHRGGDVPNFGFSRSVYWFRAALRGGEHVEHLLLEIHYPILDQVSFYAVDERGRVVSRSETGHHEPWRTRALAHRNFLFPFDLAPSERTTLYVRVRSTAAMQVPLTLWSTRAFLEQDPTASLVQGIYAGFMLVMMLYNFFLFFAVRDRMYLLYVLMVAGQLAFQFTLHGFAFALLWPDFHALNPIMAPLLIPLVTWSANAFAMEFLEVATRDPGLFRVTRHVRMACLAAATLAPLLPFDVAVVLGCVLAALASSTVVVAFFRLHAVAPRAVGMLALAWTPLLTGTFLLVAEKFGLVARGYVSENLVQIGSSFEVVVLSLALGDRINGERNAKLSAQTLALEHEQSAKRVQQEALLAQRLANENLEERVVARTHELASANARLAELSTADLLTGLKNRRHFHERLIDEFARGAREAQPVSVLLLDMDDFRRINETYGHMVGDRCLIAVAEVLGKTVSRTTDLLARYGGEEFAILLPNTGPDGARKVGEAVRRAVEGLSVEADGELVALSLCVGGVSRVPARGERREAFLGQADDALNEAKTLGRNRVVVRS